MAAAAPTTSLYQPYSRRAAMGPAAGPGVGPGQPPSVLGVNLTSRKKILEPIYNAYTTKPTRDNMKKFHGAWKANFGTVEILYTDKDGHKLITHFSGASLGGNAADTSSHGERKAWAAAQKWYQTQKPPPKIDAINIASDREPCKENDKPCDTFFGPGGDATKATAANPMAFQPGRDKFYHGVADFKPASLLVELFKTDFSFYGPKIAKLATEKTQKDFYSKIFEEIATKEDSKLVNEWLASLKKYGAEVSAMEAVLAKQAKPAPSPGADAPAAPAPAPAAAASALAASAVKAPAPISEGGAAVAGSAGALSAKFSSLASQASALQKTPDAPAKEPAKYPPQHKSPAGPASGHDLLTLSSGGAAASHATAPAAHAPAKQPGAAAAASGPASGPASAPALGPAAPPTPAPTAPTDPQTNSASPAASGNNSSDKTFKPHG